MRGSTSRCAARSAPTLRRGGVAGLRRDSVRATSPLYRPTCRHGLVPSGRQPHTSARLKALESSDWTLLAIAGVSAIPVISLAMSARVTSLTDPVLPTVEAEAHDHPADLTPELLVQLTLVFPAQWRLLIGQGHDHLAMPAHLACQPLDRAQGSRRHRLVGARGCDPLWPTIL